MQYWWHSFSHKIYIHIHIRLATLPSQILVKSSIPTLAKKIYFLGLWLEHNGIVTTFDHLSKYCNTSMIKQSNLIHTFIFFYMRVHRQCIIHVVGFYQTTISQQQSRKKMRRLLSTIFSRGLMAVRKHSTRRFSRLILKETLFPKMLPSDTLLSLVDWSKAN